MRKRIFIALPVLFAVVLGFIVLPEVFKSEPKHNGKRLSAWFEQYYRAGPQGGSPNGERRVEALDALRVFGTKAVPYLVSTYYTTNSDSAQRLKLYSLMMKLPPFLQPKPYVRRMIIRNDSLIALFELKPPRDLLESLVTNRLYDADTLVRVKTLRLLCGLKAGTNQTLPILRQMLQSGDGGKEKIATECLWNLDRAAEPAWPELLALIKNQNSDFAAVSYACRILWQFDKTDLSAVPALRARLARLGETTASLETAVLLVRFDAWQTEALDLLLKVSADRNSSSRELAINCLGAVGKNASRAGQLLYDIATTETPYLWSSAASAMLQIGETNLAMEAAYHHLKFRNQELTATYFLTRCDPTNAVAVNRLRELAWQLPYCKTAISQLGQLRPMPAAALQTLWEVSTNETHFARADATKALKILKAEQEQSLSDGR